MSVLARTLSNLLADVTERDRALQELNVSLEARVQARTEELQQANSELSAEIAQRRHIEAEREQLIARLEELASTDALTGIPNRRHFNETAAAESERALRLRHPLALVLLDIDHFKRVNDSYGHATGDKVLRHTATYCRSVLREMDTLARVGGEEFAMLLPDTDAVTARSTAERLRRGVEGLSVETRKGQVRVTVSVGVSGLAEDDRGIEDVLRRADRALYRAKDEGRNRIVVG